MDRCTIALLLVILACEGDSNASGDTTESSSTEGTDADSHASGPMGNPTSVTDGSSGETDSAGSGGTDPGTDAKGEVRFVALGDAGEGNDDQYMVAAAIEQVCAARGCDFAIYLGDNFYDDGVSSTMDSQFQDKFEMPYMDLDFRFYITLGNHDYGELSNAWEKADYEVMYTRFSDKWYLPHYWYTWQTEHVQFFSLDTTRLMWDKDTGEQQAWLDEELAGSTAAWKVVFGHHPYISNGAHGNAGNYEGGAVPLAPVIGTTVKKFMDASICGKATIYLCGHDHNRQWLVPKCSTEFIVSGAGAKNTAFEYHDDNPTFFEDDTTPGFMWVEIRDERMTGVFYDKTGSISFERTVDL